MRYMTAILRVSAVMIVLAALSPAAFAANILVNDAITYAGIDAVGGQAANASNVTGNSVTMVAGGQVGTLTPPTIA